MVLGHGHIALADSSALPGREREVELSGSARMDTQRGTTVRRTRK